MNKLHDLLSKLQAIEEAAKTSDIPAAHRKAKNPEDWKVSMKDLDDEEKEGKISHKDNLAKNSGKQINEWDVEDDTRGDGQEAAIHDAMQKLGISLNDINAENVWDIGEKISQAIGSGYNDYYRTNSEHRDVPAEDVLDYLSNHIDLSELSEESTELTTTVEPETTQDPQDGAGASDESIATECGDMPMGASQGGNKVELSMTDLLKLMAQLSKGQDPSVGGGDQPLMGDSYENEPNPEVAPVSAVLPTGNDMHSKGSEAEKVNGGGNPLQAQLAELYADIKARQLDELSNDTLKSYTKKAAADLNDRAYLSGHAYGKGKGDINREKKAFSRQAGIEKAVDKMSLKEANQMARNLRK